MDARVKKLRTNMTEAERKLWTHLRGRQLAAVKFRREHLIGLYVVDFVALEPKLIIEIDGGHHARQVEQDAERSNWLVNNGFRVLRFWNHEVLHQTDKVLEAIKHSLLTRVLK